MSRREIVKFCNENELYDLNPPSSPQPKLMRKRSTRAAGRPLPELVAKSATRQKRGKAAPPVVNIAMKMEMVAKMRRLGNDQMECLVKFVRELPNGQSDDLEDGTVKIRFEDFDGQTWSEVMDFADSLTKVETDMKRQKTEEPAFPS